MANGAQFSGWSTDELLQRLLGVLSGAPYSGLSTDELLARIVGALQNSGNSAGEFSSLTVNGNAQINGNLFVGDADTLESVFISDGLFVGASQVNLDGTKLYNTSGENAIDTSTNPFMVCGDLVWMGETSAIQADGSGYYSSGVISWGSTGDFYIGENLVFYPDGTFSGADDFNLSSSGDMSGHSWEIYHDGNATFANDNLMWDTDGNLHCASIDGNGSKLTFPSGDPSVNGVVYEDPVTHALFVSRP